MNALNLPKHSYEEIREAVIGALLETPSTQWVTLQSTVATRFARKENRLDPHSGGFRLQPLHPEDAELIRDVFWDLFRQGFITLGMNDSNPQWPFFRLSHFGEKTLAVESPYRFHDPTSFVSLVQKEVPDISSDAIIYLSEAVSTFYTGSLLASCVMLGVAAEIEFLRLVDVALKSRVHASKFTAVEKATFIRQKITKFQDALRPIIPSFPHGAAEDWETNFLMIQSVLRIARNDAGHPTGANPQREQVYVYLQLFVPFTRQLMRLRNALV